MREELIIDQIIHLKNRCDLDSLIGRSYRLSPREVSCIYLLDGNPLNSKALSQLMGVSPSRGSRIIHRLEQKGFVVSRPDSGDRRNQIIELSKYGKSCLPELDMEKRACEVRFLDSLNADEIEKVRQGIKILLQAI
jgi:DNA-binding MarR family transcriptional regulator